MKIIQILLVNLKSIRSKSYQIIFRGTIVKTGWRLIEIGPWDDESKLLAQAEQLHVR